MNFSRLIGIAFTGILLISCSPTDDLGLNIFSYSFDFNENLYEWKGDFTDYPAVEDSQNDSIYRWKFDYVTLPSSLGNRKSIALSSNNLTGDLFMFMKKKISGLQPDTDYTIVFEIELASNATQNQSVLLKAGASDVEPLKIIQGNMYTLNISSGENIVVLGNVPGTPQPTLITKSNDTSYDRFTARSNSNGELWLMVGTDSSYTGITTVYYTKVNVVFSVSNQI